ncbi:MAG TPA: hypothetical protein VGS97_13030 [Actinocrinis sp.]|uniref:hypothetical protein n=1 Tax=Actinocrinis sp. TaxID=1920516 RepID=UPI002DDCD83B|nr:hypothetical protein [Actinocrinis sp.]HEV2345013.1 hypothetical protein [Actinocrinis sp.]
MGAHRKPKARPTAFAAVVTAAIVVPAGTAAATSYSALGSPKGGKPGLAAGSLAADARSAATSAAKSPVRHVVAVTPGPTRSASVSPSAAKPSLSTAVPKPAAASPSASAKPAAPRPSASASPSATAAAAAAKPNPVQSVSLASLEPTGLYGGQQYFTLTGAQWSNAKTIVAVTEQRGMPLYAAVIAIATAMQESSLLNLTYATNYDSLGLFQQRPSMGWGTAAQVTDPVYATNAFLAALAAYAPGYEGQALWISAQAVQRSGLPTAYAQWEDQAAQIVLAIANGTE